MHPNEMKRLIWLTDIHFDFLLPQEIEEFASAVVTAKSDAILITGDIATSGNLCSILPAFASQVNAPIYFVLGNHDCYGGSISGTRESVRALVANSTKLYWLSGGLIVPLTRNACLIGHDGWADGRIAPGRNSGVMLNDYLLIKEFSGLSQQTRFDVMNKLGDESAAYFREVLPRACQHYQTVLLLTHVPPFKEACWYKGRTPDSDYVPHFTCQAVGDVLRQVMAEFPQCQLTVLCGHTHNAGVAQISPNLLVKTGGAEYGLPRIQEVLTLP